MVPDLCDLVLVVHQHLGQRHPALGVLLQEVEAILLLRVGRQTHSSLLGGQLLTGALCHCHLTVLSLEAYTATMDANNTNHYFLYSLPISSSPHTTATCH